MVEPFPCLGAPGDEDDLAVLSASAGPHGDLRSVHVMDKFCSNE